MHHTRKTLSVKLWLVVCVVVSVLALRIIQTEARAAVQTQEGGPTKTDTDAAVFHEYKGVGLGMTAVDARKKLGKPTEKDDEQDFYLFSDKESAQIYYDKSKTVMAFSVNYVGDGSVIPKPKAVFGTDVLVKPDGSMYQLIRFPKAGYWVSYSRTAGDSPITTITVQKIP